MRALVQRVERASVTVDGEVVGAVAAGLCVLVGVTHDDGGAQADRLAAKVAGLRIMDDDDGVMNRSVVDVGGSVPAAPPEQAEPLVERVVAALRAEGLEVATGRFRAEMQVELVNDGPVTLLLEV